MADSTSFSVPRVALVTGAAKRLGRAIALELARAGFDIAVHYRHSQADAEQTVADIQALGRRAVALSADLSIEKDAQTLVPRAAQALGVVGALVNNASRFDYDDALSMNWTGLDQHMRANLAAPLTLAQTLFQHLPATARGVVVNLLDQKLWNPNPDFFTYTLSKQALEGATRVLAQALAPQVRIVGVAPGLTLTSDWISDEEFERLHTMSPLGRSSTPQDIAGAVRFAIENPAITGTTLLIDGGQHLLPLARDFSMLKS